MGTWDDPVAKIMINGTIPLEVHVEEEERRERLTAEAAKAGEIYKDNSSEISSIKKSYYFRPQFGNPTVSKKLNSSVKQYSLADQIDYILRQNGKERLIGAFSALPVTKRKQIEHLVSFYRVIKGKAFRAADMDRQLKETEFKDVRRKLLLLEQAGLLKRIEDGGYLKYERISFASEAAVIATMLVNADRMKGFSNYALQWRQQNKRIKPNKPINTPVSPETKKSVIPDPQIPRSDFERFFGQQRALYPTASIDEIAAKYVEHLRKNGR